MKFILILDFWATLAHPPFLILHIRQQIRNQRPLKPPYTNFYVNWMKFILVLDFWATLADPPFWILHIRQQIRNQRHLKPPYTNFYVNCMKFILKYGFLNHPRVGTDFLCSLCHPRGDQLSNESKIIKIGSVVFASAFYIYID